MNTVSKLVVAVGILATSHAAFAFLPFASVRKQVYAEAKNEGALKGLKRPSMRLQYSKDRKTVTASIYSLGNSWPTFKQSRLLQETAKFKVTRVIDGTFAQPVKQNGQVWQPVFRALRANNAK